MATLTPDMELALATLLTPQFDFLSERDRMWVTFGSTVERDLYRRMSIITYKYEGLEIIAKRNDPSGPTLPIEVYGRMRDREEFESKCKMLKSWYLKALEKEREGSDNFWVIDYKNGTKELHAVKDFKNDHVQLMYGSHNFRTCNSRVNWWAMLTKTDSGGRVLPSTILSRFGNTSSTGASTGTSSRSDVGGWTTERLLGRDGVFLVGRVMSNPGMHTDAVILRLRHDAPMIKIDFKLSVDAQAVYENLAAFIGRADMIPPTEAYTMAEFQMDDGVDPCLPPMQWFSIDDDLRQWEMKELVSGTPKPVMKPVFTGREYKSVPIPKSNRKLRLRR